MMIPVNRLERLLLALLLAHAAPAAGQAAGVQATDSLEATIRLDRGEGAIVEPGDEVRIYYRTSADAWVAIFRVDTDGRVELLMPQHPEAEVFARGGREYRLLLADGRRWSVDEGPGEGSFFMIASPEPLDFESFDFDAETGWDLSGAGAAVYEDPFAAIDDYVVAVLPEWDQVAYALDFETYEVVEAGASDRLGEEVRRESSYRTVVIAAPWPAPRYRLPPRVARWGYARPPHYGPPPPRARPWRYAPGYRPRPPRPVHYGPARGPAPRYRAAPGRRPPVARPPVPGRARFKEGPRRPRG